MDRCDYKANVIYEVVAIKLFETLLANLSSVEKNLLKSIVICYASRSFTICLAAIGNITAGIRSYRLPSGTTQKPDCFALHHFDRKLVH